jgi:hypothetical protein
LAFQPARSPHFGGLWEAGIKAVKEHIKRVIGQTLLTYEEMYTLLTGIKPCLNSRPLCPLTEDPSDLNVLTPGHFLIDTAMPSSLEHQIIDVPQNCLTAARRADETALLEPLVQGVRRPAARAAKVAEGQFQRSNQRRRSGGPEGVHTPAHLETRSRHSRPPGPRRHHPRGHSEDGLRHSGTTKRAVRNLNDFVQ